MTGDCPSELELRAFHAGMLGERALDAVADHIEECQVCGEALERLDTSVDPLLAALREAQAAVTVHGPAPWPAEPAKPAALPLDAPNLPGYEVLALLGRGGMGMVYRARQLALNRLVALKQLRPANPSEQARARTEAEALALLRHPHIVQIYEVIEHDERVYLSLELIAGGSLADQLTGKPRSAREAAGLLEVLAATVHYAHSQGIVHRDLKPANILLEAVDSGPDLLAHAGHENTLSPKISDFGIAKWLSIGPSETRHGDVIGTPSYMSPEQAAGQIDRIGPTTDVFSLGVILYEMLTGRVPFQGPTTLETLRLLRSEEPVAPRRLQPRTPRDLETICLKCLEKEPGHRYPRADGLAADLRRFLAGKPIEARPTPVWERTWKWAKRRPAVAALSAAVVLVAALGFALVGWQWRRAEGKAVDEFQARRAAEQSQRNVERLSTSIMLNQAEGLCESGEVARGLLWFARALEVSERISDGELGRVARLNLAAWHPFLVRPRALCDAGGVVTCMLFHADSQTLVTGGEAGAHLWNVVDGRLRRGPLASGAVRSLAMSPDGTLFLTGGGSDAGPGEARLWNISRGRSARPPLVHSGPVTVVAFADEGRTVLTVCPDEVRLWRTADCQPIGAPMKHPRLVVDEAFARPMIAAVSPDGRLIATGGGDKIVRLWNAATAAPVRVEMTATQPVVVFAFSPDSQTLLAGSSDGGVRMWDVATGERRGESLRLRGHVRTVAFSPDGRIAAAAGAIGYEDREPSGEVQLCQVETGQNLGAALPHPRPVRTLAFSPDGRLLLTGCDDALARIFLTATGAPLGTPLKHHGPITAVAFSKDGASAATASAGHKGDRFYQPSQASIRLWRMPAESAFGQALVQPGDVVELAFSPKGDALLTGQRDGGARLWNLDSGNSRELSARHAGEIAALAFAPNGESFITAAADGAKLWRRSELTATLLPAQAVTSAAFAPDSSNIGIGCESGEISLYHSDQPVGSLPAMAGPVRSVEFAADGQRLLAGGTSAALWDWRARTLLQRQPTSDDVAGEALLYPGDQQALVLSAGAARTWDFTRRDWAPSPPWGSEAIERAAFDRSAGLILTAGSDGIARLRDIATGKTIGPPLGRDRVRAVAAAPEAQLYAAGGSDGRITLWRGWRPLDGSGERLRLWVETLTGLELAAQETIHELSSDALAVRGRRLAELGGPPVKAGR